MAVLRVLQLEVYELQQACFAFERMGIKFSHPRFYLLFGLGGRAGSQEILTFPDQRPQRFQHASLQNQPLLQQSRFLRDVLFLGSFNLQ